MHAKINRKNLNKLNIINICEEILNPSVPMALRLSGILMGGVVIVYERKVKLLYEDVTRLLVEINGAWKVKVTRDHTLLPKGKSQAKYEAVTLPDNQPADLSEFEQHMQFSNSDTLMGMNKSAYFEMNFDNIDDSYISLNQGGVDLPNDHHQANIENITIFDRYDSHPTDAFNRFERFDIEGDDNERDLETEEKFPSHTHSDLPNTLVPSPPRHDEPQKPDEIPEQHPGDHSNHQSDEDKARNMPQRQKPSRKRVRRAPAVIMDYEQTMIPAQMYQSWLQDTSDLVSGRGRKRKQVSSISSVKIDRLMDQPPVALFDGLFINGNMDIYYPYPLLQQWIKLTQPVHDSPSGKTSSPNPPAASSLSPPPETNNFHDPTPFEDYHSGVGSGSLELSREKPMPMENGVNVSDANGPPAAEVDIAVTPANSGNEVKSGLDYVPHGLFVNSGWPHKKKLFSSSRRSGSLDPVAEEFPMDHTKKTHLSSTTRSRSSLGPMEEDFPMDHSDPNFKIIDLPENELAPENDLMVETGPTQTQKVPVPDQPMEQLTNSIRKQLKTHFDTPGSTQTESLNQLAMGLDRKKAACLFYQTCVMATRDYIKVLQMEPYGNIQISRGGKM